MAFLPKTCNNIKISCGIKIGRVTVTSMIMLSTSTTEKINCTTNKLTVRMTLLRPFFFPFTKNNIFYFSFCEEGKESCHNTHFHVGGVWDLFVFRW